jgi:hypothetical protein
MNLAILITLRRIRIAMDLWVGNAGRSFGILG